MRPCRSHRCVVLDALLVNLVHERVFLDEACAWHLARRLGCMVGRKPALSFVPSASDIRADSARSVSNALLLALRLRGLYVFLPVEQERADCSVVTESNLLDPDGHLMSMACAVAASAVSRREHLAHVLRFAMLVEIVHSDLVLRCSRVSDLDMVGERGKVACGVHGRVRSGVTRTTAWGSFRSHRCRRR